MHTARASNLTAITVVVMVKQHRQIMVLQKDVNKLLHLMTWRIASDGFATNVDDCRLEGERV